MQGATENLGRHPAVLEACPQKVRGEQGTQYRRELKIIQTSVSGDACTYLLACAICDGNETCQQDKEGHSRWLVGKADAVQSLGDEQQGRGRQEAATNRHDGSPATHERQALTLLARRL